MIKYFRDGAYYVAVETGMPHEAVRIGVAVNPTRAFDDLGPTPIQSAGPDSGVAAALRWAHHACWISAPELPTDGEGGQTMNTIERAISRSISHTEIVTLTPTDDREHDRLREALYEVCYDFAAADGWTEYWGTDGDGDEWRVHVRLPEGGN